ncbi:MAG: dimethylarginine dimethylaminohydrolase family protein [Planctomycetaceae bacterium]
MSRVYASRAALPRDFHRSALPPMPAPRAVLLCPPDAFDVVDVKNPFMEGQAGRVDRAEARRQWDALGEAFARCGLAVHRIAPTPGCEDMVFCANQTFCGLDADGARVCILSHMAHASRRREVPAFAAWFAARGYAVEDPFGAGVPFEGCGDALWHPGRGLIWGGCGGRTAREAYAPLAERFGAPVLTLELVSPRFYHLDTCFCPLDETTLLLHPPALAPEGLELAAVLFDRIVEVDEEEAVGSFACNAAAFEGGSVLLQRGAERTVAALRRLGYRVVEVETGEFMKSGGSVFCLKMGVY